MVCHFILFLFFCFVVAVLSFHVVHENVFESHGEALQQICAHLTVQCIERGAQGAYGLS